MIDFSSVSCHIKKSYGTLVSLNIWSYCPTVMYHTLYVPDTLPKQDSAASCSLLWGALSHPFWKTHRIWSAKPWASQTWTNHTPCKYSCWLCGHSQACWDSSRDWPRTLLPSCKRPPWTQFSASPDIMSNKTEIDRDKKSKVSLQRTKSKHHWIIKSPMQNNANFESKTASFLKDFQTETQQYLSLWSMSMSLSHVSLCHMSSIVYI